MPPRSEEDVRPIPAMDLEQPQASAYLGSLRRGNVPPLLFSGPEGTGKELTAIDFARRLQCEKDEPCSLDGPKCTSCLRASIIEHPGIHLIYPTPTQGSNEDEDGDVTDIAKILGTKRGDIFASESFSKKTSIRIARARAVIQRANTKPFDARYHVFIFVDAHARREEAQNALLKLVEEPPAHVVMIFVTPNHEALLYTIRSRCQRVRFFPLKRTVLEKILTGYLDVEAAKAKRTAALAQGSIVRARALLESGDLADRDAALGLVAGIAKQPESWLFAQALVGARGANRESVARVLDEMAVILRDAMAGSAALVVNGDIQSDIERVAASWGREKLPRAIELVHETRAQVFYANANIDGALADLFLKLKRLQ
ncbi:MAG TPA: AAA family ATPase [Candidatus Krumholzibacteria bacterium]|nr:AAA family ATPase [Candidatus Krumholzibacteria bacterium]